MLMKVEKAGNMDQVRSALQGITGQEPAIQSGPAKNSLMWVVRSNREFEAVDSMRRQLVRAYWPSYERLVATKHRFENRPVRRLVRSGIIPYVFTPEVDDIAGVVEQSVGVIDVVRTFSGSPLLLKETDIAIIRKIDVGMNTPKPEAAAHNFKIGEKVRFTDDIMAHWPPGTIIKLARDGRIIVDQALMGRKVPVTVFPFQIEKT